MLENLEGQIKEAHLFRWATTPLLLLSEHVMNMFYKIYFFLA